MTGGGGAPAGGNLELRPGNDLERILKRAAGGRTTPFRAFNFFLNSLVVSLAKENGGAAAPAPLMLCGPEREPLLALFSSMERALPVRRRHPKYTRLVTAPAWQMIHGLAPDRGLVLNPGWNVGLALGPARLEEYRKHFGLERKTPPDDGPCD